MVNDKNISTKYVEKTYNKSYVMNIIEQLVLELRKKGIPFECSIDEKGTGGAYRDEGTIKGGRHHKIVS